MNKKQQQSLKKIISLTEKILKELKTKATAQEASIILGRALNAFSEEGIKVCFMMGNPNTPAKISMQIEAINRNIQNLYKEELKKYESTTIN